MACALAGLAFAGVSAAASAATGETWAIAPSANGMFSVETPCTEAEVVGFRSLPDEMVPELKFIPGSRVVCRRGQVILVAAEVGDPDYPKTGLSVFDSIVEQAKGDKTAEGTPTITTLNGRRAFVNRQEKDAMLAQTGFVEIDRGRIIMLIAGVQADSGLSVKDQGALIDRFYSSVKVTGK